MTVDGYADPRLEYDSQGLTGLLGAVFYDREEISQIADGAGIPRAEISAEGKPIVVWGSIVRYADSNGKFERLLAQVQRRMPSTDRRLPLLRAWIDSFGIRHVAESRRQLLTSYNRFFPTREVEPLVRIVDQLSNQLFELARMLADTESARRDLGELPDVDYTIRRCRELTRHASATVDSLLFELREIVVFLDRPSASQNDRDIADRTLARTTLVHHMFGQKAAADQSLSALLEILRAAVPTALDDTPLGE